MNLFSVAKIFQRVMKYFCSERCPRVQRIIGIFLRIFGARKIRVALEHKGLARVLEGKMNIFHLRKIFQAIFWVDPEVKWWFWGGEGALGWKSRSTQVVKSKWSDSKTPNSKPTQLKIKKKKGGQNQAVTNLPHLEWISSSRFGCLGKPFWITCP